MVCGRVGQGLEQWSVGCNCFLHQDFWFLVIRCINFNSSFTWLESCVDGLVVHEIIYMCWLKVLFLNLEEGVSHLNYKLAVYKIVLLAYHQ